MLQGELNMPEDFFIIPQSKIDENWRPIDLSYEFFALEYCEEILDIPLYYIDEAIYNEEGLEVSLKNFEKNIVIEDWYIQLHRLSTYARAS